MARTGRPRKWSDEQRAEALTLYVELGPSAASERTGIPKQLITRWGKAATLSTVTKVATREATEVVVAQRKLKRETALNEMHDLLLATIRAVYEPHIEFVGQNGRQVTYPRAPAGAWAKYVESIERLIKTIRLEEGETPGTQVTFDFRTLAIEVAERHGIPVETLLGVYQDVTTPASP